MVIFEQPVIFHVILQWLQPAQVGGWPHQMPGRARRETLVGTPVGLWACRAEHPNQLGPKQLPRCQEWWHMAWLGRGEAASARTQAILLELWWQVGVYRKKTELSKAICLHNSWLFVQIGPIREVEPCQDSMGDIFLLLSPWSKGRQDTSVCEFQCDESLSPRWGDHSGEMRVGACSCPHWCWWRLQGSTHVHLNAPGRSH